MNALLQAKYSLYYLIRATVDSDVSVQMSNSFDEVVFPSVVISGPDVSSSPLQLGGGSFDSFSFILNIFSKNSRGKDVITYDIYNRLRYSGVNIVDYSPYEKDGVVVSNFPYDPATSTTKNSNYDNSRFYCHAEFDDVSVDSIVIDRIDNEDIHRSVIQFSMTLALDSIVTE